MLEEGYAMDFVVARIKKTNQSDRMLKMMEH